ncbi:hypothetical protein [Catenuloplanes japonicus]|uniref:hypothetical protein n=1 Tax=Catenuloplanes japonicus TaxID=33876 RepID=UPI0005253B68|nr:hypothetical protein [Catenuloplanes japonicus]
MSDAGEVQAAVDRWAATLPQPRPTALLAEIEASAARLREDGTPIVLPPIGRALDLYDLVLAEGVPFVPDDGGAVDLLSWFADEAPGRRSLRALAACPPVRERFREACAELLSSYYFGADPSAREPMHPHLLGRALAVPGVRDALTAHVDAVTARLERLPITPMAEALRSLVPLRSPAGQAAFGVFLDRVRRLDLDAAVARTLRCGLPQELAWDAWDRACAELAADQVRVVERWPRLAVYDYQNAVVLGADGIAARHRVPGGPGWIGAFSRGGRLFFTSYDGTGGGRGFWADAPDEVFVPDDSGQPPSSGDAASDLDLLDSAGSGRFAEVPVADAVRRHRWPAVGEGFGLVGGEAGWDVVDTPGGLVVRAIDGREVALPDGADLDEIAGVLRIPGVDVLVTAGRSGAVRLWDAASGTVAYRPPEWSDPPPELPPPAWWDRLQPRDPAASAGLRAMDALGAAALRAAHARTGGGALSTAPVPPSDPVVAAQPVPTADPVLTAAVARVVRDAELVAEEIAGFAALAGMPHPAPVSAYADDRNITNGLAGLVSTGQPRVITGRVDGPLPGFHVLGHVARVGAALAATSSAHTSSASLTGTKATGPHTSGAHAATTSPGPTSAAGTHRTSTNTGGTNATTHVARAEASHAVPTWWRVLPTPGALMLRAAMETTPEPIRAALAALLAAVADAGLDRCRLVVTDGDPDSGVVVGHLSEGTASLIRAPADARLPEDRLRRFVTLLHERGPIRWNPAWTQHLPMPSATATILATGALHLATADDFTPPADYLTATGLTARRERTESRKLARLPSRRLRRLLDAAVPADVTRLWSAGPEMAALAAAWRAGD